MHTPSLILIALKKTKNLTNLISNSYKISQNRKIDFFLKLNFIKIFKTFKHDITSYKKFIN